MQRSKELSAKIKQCQNQLDNLMLELLMDFRDGRVIGIKSSEYGLKTNYRCLDEMLTSLGFVNLEVLDTNGWENDYWDKYEYKKDGKVKVARVFGTMASGFFELSWND